MKYIFKYYLLIIAIFLFSGCSDKQNIKVKIATNIWPGYERLYLAQSQNFFDKDLIEVKELSSATDVLRAYRNDLINAAALTLDETLPLLQSGYDGKIILIFDISHGGDVIMSKSDIKSFKDLKNKRIAVENTALGSYMITRALEIHHMSEDDIKIVPALVSEHYDLYVENKIDAAVTFEPVKTKLLELGANEVFSSKEIPNEIIDILIVKDEIYNNKVVLKNIIDGFFKADEFARDNPRLAASIMAKREGISTDEFIDSLEGLNLPNKEEHQKLFENGTITNTLNSLKKIMLKKKLLQKDVKIQRLLP